LIGLAKNLETYWHVLVCGYGGNFTNIPNTLVQKDITRKLNGKTTIRKIQGQLVDMLVNISPEDYQDFVCTESNHKVLYVEMLKALYGMHQLSLLYYKKFLQRP
jgi:hypothetical protein